MTENTLAQTAGEDPQLLFEGEQMKLLYCPKCRDLFRLRADRIQRCDCGLISGRYEPDGVQAVTNGKGVALSMGDASLHRAIKALREDPAGGDLHVATWVRPNSGTLNPHSRVEEGL